ncbi:hypothetical protein P3S67_028731 [Capsicum chacoense]
MSSNTIPLVKDKSIRGFLLIVSNILYAAACPAANAIILSHEPIMDYKNFLSMTEGSMLTWLNSHPEKIWPYVDEAASELVKANVEPILEQYRPVILASLKFSKFTLDTVAPQFIGIFIIKDGSEGITMELEMQWDGNSSIILNIKTYLGVALLVQVIYFRSVLLRLSKNVAAPVSDSPKFH